MIGALVPSLSVALGIGVLVGAWMLKLAIADAYAMAATLLAYHRTTEGMPPDPEWQVRLEPASGKFAELKEKVLEKTTGGASAKNGTFGAEAGVSNDEAAAQVPSWSQEAPGEATNGR